MLEQRCSTPVGGAWRGHALPITPWLLPPLLLLPEPGPLPAFIASPVCARPQKAKSVAQPDELIDFHHLKMRKGLSKVEIEDSVASDLARATGLADAASAASNRLNKIVQLTGFSDPIYAEAYVTGAQGMAQRQLCRAGPSACS